MHDTKAHLSEETEFNHNHYLPIPFSMRFEPFGEQPSMQTSRGKLISLTKTKHASVEHLLESPRPGIRSRMTDNIVGPL